MSSRTAATADTESDDLAVPWQNSVTLCGRLTAGPEPVELPSGDPLWRFRVTVERPVVRTARAGTGPTRRTVDAVDCSTGVAKLAARLERLAVGSVVEVGGVLTRRFWRAAGGPASRYEVVVDRVTVVKRPAASRTAGVTG